MLLSSVPAILNVEFILVSVVSMRFLWENGAGECEATTTSSVPRGSQGRSLAQHSSMAACSSIGLPGEIPD